MKERRLSSRNDHHGTQLLPSGAKECPLIQMHLITQTSMQAIPFLRPGPQADSHSLKYWLGPHSLSPFTAFKKFQINSNTKIIFELTYEIRLDKLRQKMKEN